MWEINIDESLLAPGGRPAQEFDENEHDELDLPVRGDNMV